MASKPITELAMETIMTRLKAITVANGYSRDVDPANIRRLVTWSIADTVPMPSILVFQGDIDVSVTEGAVGFPQVTMALGILYMDHDQGTSRPTTINEMRADITRAVGSEFEVTDSQGNTGMIEPVPVGSEAGLAEADQSVVYVAVGYDIRFQHAWGDETRFN